MAKQIEGWQAEKHYNQRRYHYIVDTFALCRGLGFYMGELMPWTGKATRSRSQKRAVERFNNIKTIL